MMLTAMLARAKFSEDILLGGFGGRLSNNRKMQGMTIQSLKRHYGLVPLFLIFGMEVAWTLYFAYHSSKNPDVAWRHEEQPYNAYQYKNSKLMNVAGIDHRTEGQNIPKYH